jgi:hypothetical protein
MKRALQAKSEPQPYAPRLGKKRAAANAGLVVV